MTTKKLMTLPSGVVILQPDGIIAVGPHDEGQTALYTAGGTILVTDALDLTVATITGDKKALDEMEAA